MKTKKMVRGSAWLVLAMGLVGLLAACGAEATPTSTPTPEPPPVPAGATPEPTPTPDVWAAWNELVAKAKEEGELVIVATNGLPKSHQKTLDYFEDKFGIALTVLAGSGRNASNRVLAERGQGLYSVDIVSQGTSTTERFRAGGALEPAGPWIIHPEITAEARKDPSQWYFDEIVWIDRDKKYAMAESFNIGPVMNIWYSTERVSEAELASITSYEDLLRPEFKGRIGGLALNDERIGTGVIRGIIALGQDYVDRLHTDAELQLVGGEADGDLVDGLLRGRWDFAVFGGRDQAEEALLLGLPLNSMSYTRPPMKEGEMVTFGSEIRAAMVNRAPHPNAAALFYNWVRTREGQILGLELRENDADPSPSLRADVPQLTVSDEKWAKAMQLLEWRDAGVLEDEILVIKQDEEFFRLKTELWKEYNERYKGWGYDAWVIY